MYFILRCRCDTENIKMWARFLFHLHSSVLVHGDFQEVPHLWRESHARRIAKCAVHTCSPTGGGERLYLQSSELSKGLIAALGGKGRYGVSPHQVSAHRYRSPTYGSFTERCTFGKFKLFSCNHRLLRVS